ncbi:2-oxo-4-hydroxy-4-carboxy-5-ureidoimidazoline decarboxylase [Streptomyces sp. SID13666]|uniref:2-oxo-4-hydroxy-4-carboxy-5-ureidoimidazoline decarboxylase n=1 Tax=Streptomyces TaxID=1883 RepID=UPI001106F764|nr:MULTISPECIES: 2-oxo-4-hydroxy-4-carboxy-5-ureidoimidazoline decarboxylase [Streptomyces]MCZ4099614.1 2-oxo-4-hydroxy-4-carboxy-5-ureidoimidazoline decarboxylase [Streptomyces sp. H39-C1]NEA58912.1 2-oxo-4-hydroxy-4-carboxy-5-ureidoimidazoline decarboxylase [Streptomyces sp. SID13666]NEA72972.1 2-oxo-4-hydroxy-4-carboxy-5-ureidoimidazoline decarboxylase [Streptomyces sp. SID13588]QNA78182.1 2-oxo-4-hydroxy-4-carboxy-5-ureidoimidazoline decarboxylase [Streptomyces sp. So13.3]
MFPDTPAQGPVPAAGLSRLNEAPFGAAEAALRDCCGSHRWARRMALHRPYPDLDALLAAADEAAYDLTPGDLSEALACEAATPLPHRGGLAAHTALSAAQAAYENKFGNVFVIALKGDDPASLLNQVLTGIRARLANDEDEERVVTADELRRITRARLARLVSERSNAQTTAELHR